MPKHINNKNSKKISQKSVPYKRGFKRPTERQQSGALGWPDTELVAPEFRSDVEFFQPVPQCTSIDDWLAQYNESGQTFNDFLIQCPWFPRRKADRSVLSKRFPEKAIYVVQVGDFQSENSPDFAALVDYARTFLGLPVRTLNPIGLEITKTGHVDWIMSDEGRTTKIHVKCRHNTASGHYQLNVEATLELLKKLKPNSALCLIALTVSDLYEAPRDLFVAGMASGNQYVAIFSLFRYDPYRKFSSEFWYGIESNRRICGQEKRRKLILQRSCRLLVHETAHLLGIDHCIFYVCSFLQ